MTNLILFAATVQGLIVQPPAPKVTVRVSPANLVSRMVLWQAESIAGRIFSGIGVAVKWEDGLARDPAASCARANSEEIGVVFRLSLGTRHEDGHELGIALPYARHGTRVTIFYDLVRATTRKDSHLESAVLAHVLAHELGHVLEGVARHSAEGVMRGQWDIKDYLAMASKPMAFDRIDAEMIRTGLDLRWSRSCGGATAPLTQPTPTH